MTTWWLAGEWSKHLSALNYLMGYDFTHCRGTIILRDLTFLRMFNIMSLLAFSTHRLLLF